jgi:hypothetical protein
MNDHDIAEWLREVAGDVPHRSDAEALARLRRRASRNRRVNRIRSGALVAATAAIAVVAWVVAVPGDDEVDVASNGQPSPSVEPTTTHEVQPAPADSIVVESDLDAYTGIHMPLVTVSADGTRVAIYDIFNVDEDTQLLDPHATVTVPYPVAWAATGPRGASVFVVSAADNEAILVDLDSGRELRRWSNTVSAVSSPMHDQVARVESRPEGNVVIVEELDGDGQRIYTPLPGAASPSGPLSWSTSGLAVSQDDGTVAVLNPETMTEYVQAQTVPGPIFAATWNEGRLIGTAQCCDASPIVTVDPNTGNRETQQDVLAEVAVAASGGGSPWGVLYLDANGDVRGTQGPDGPLVQGVSQLRW